MKGYRTIILNLVAMVGMLVTLLTGTETKDEVTTIQEHALLILESGIVAWGILAVWVRRMTDTPMGMGKEVSYRPGKRR